MKNHKPKTKMDARDYARAIMTETFMEIIPLLENIIRERVPPEQRQATRVACQQLRAEFLQQQRPELEDCKTPPKRRSYVPPPLFPEIRVNEHGFLEYV